MTPSLVEADNPKLKALRPHDLPKVQLLTRHAQAATLNCGWPAACIVFLTNQWPLQLDSKFATDP